MAIEPTRFGFLPPEVAQHAVRILELALRLEKDGTLNGVGGLTYLVDLVAEGEAARLPGETTEELVHRQMGEMKRRLHERYDHRA
jgi:predicted transcriptional regulator of viral defense system